MRYLLLSLGTLALACSALFSSCKKDDSSGSVSNSTSSPFTIKYEITADKPVLSAGSAQYTNSSGALSTELYPIIPWTKTVTVTTTLRPFILFLNATSYQLSSAGNLTGKIFINGVQKATVTIPSTNSNNSTFQFVPMISVQFAVQ